MHELLFERLNASKFRSGFKLTKNEKQYCSDKGYRTIKKHATDFVSKRLAPADISNDGKQTPMRGHPVFKAQHATGCCCRGCFEKWHKVPPGVAFTDREIQYAVSVIMEWITREMKGFVPEQKTGTETKVRAVGVAESGAAEGSKVAGSESGLGAVESSKAAESGAEVRGQRGSGSDNEQIRFDI